MLKSIDSTDLRNNMSDALDAVADGQTLIVKKRGKDKIVMIDVDSYEDYLAAQNPEYIKEIETARAEAKRGEVFSIEDVFGNI